MKHIQSHENQEKLYEKYRIRKFDGNLDYFYRFFIISDFDSPRNINIHIQKINAASTRISGSPFLDFFHRTIFFLISNGRPECRTFDRNFESSSGTSNVRPEIRTFDQNFERSA